MNRLHRLLAGLGIAAISLTACGGGGGGGATPNVSHPQATKFPIGTGGTPASMSARQTVGTVSLTLTLPKVLTAKTGTQAIRAKVPATALSALTRRGAASKARTTTSALRKGPQYVNPACGECENLLDIYVDGSLISNLDGQAGPYDSMYVQYTSDGTQNITLPLYSTGTNDIVAVEWDGQQDDYVLAMGETWVGGFTAGTAVSGTLTMLQNTAFIGIVDSYLEQAQVLTSAPAQPFYGDAGSCGSSGPQNSGFGLYSADALGSFVPVAGYGGTSSPVVTSEVPDNGGTTKAGQSSISGLYFLSWDNNCDGVTVNATTTNPAYAITTDVVGPYQYTRGYPGYSCWHSSQHNYTCSDDGPFDSYGNGTDAYGNCAFEGKGCPGGPYQGIYTLMYYWNDANWCPLVGCFYDSTNYYGGINPPTTSGSVDIEDSYPPFAVNPNPLTSLLAVGQQATLTIYDPTGYDGYYYAYTKNSNVATVNSYYACCGSGTQFTVTAQGAGTTNIDFNDNDNRYYQVQVIVTTTTIPIQ